MITPSKTPRTDAARGFHYMETAVAAEEMEKIELELTQEKVAHAGTTMLLECREAELAAHEALTGKAAEAMGFVRFAAISWGLAGESWSEERGFAQKMTAELMNRERELTRLKSARYKYEDDPEMVFNEDLGWVHMIVQEEFNDLRAELAAERARSEKLVRGIKSILPAPPYHPLLEPEWVYLSELVSEKGEIAP